MYFNPGQALPGFIVSLTVSGSQRVADSDNGCQRVADSDNGCQRVADSDSSS